MMVPSDFMSLAHRHCSSGDVHCMIYGKVAPPARIPFGAMHYVKPPEILGDLHDFRIFATEDSLIDQKSIIQ